MQGKQRILLKENIEFFFFGVLLAVTSMPKKDLPICDKLFLVFVISINDITIHGFQTFF